MSQNREEEARMLGAMLVVHEKALEQALAVANREEPIVSSLRRAIAALMGEAPQGHLVTTNGANLQSSFIVDGQHRMAALRTIHQVQSSVPTRKAEYAQSTIIEAMHRAFEKIAPTGFVHIDKIVDEVYNPIEDRDVFYRIKRTLVSEVIRGMKKGLFVRGPEPNAFGLAPPTRVARTAEH
jgi:hypothetical protein